MRVAAVAESKSLDLRCVSRGVLLPEVSTDSRVVLGSHRERFQCKAVAQSLADIAIAVFPCLEEGSVVGRVRKDRDAFMVLRRSAKKGNAADIDLLDSVCQGAIRLGDRFGEGVQVANDDGDGCDALCL